jgi:hypothetical protein
VLALCILCSSVAQLFLNVNNEQIFSTFSIVHIFLANATGSAVVGDRD